MEISVLYFARVRELLKIESEKLNIDGDSCSVGDVVRMLRSRGQPWDEVLHPEASVRYAVDQEFADLSAEVRPGSELAVFPPITGG